MLSAIIGATAISALSVSLSLAWYASSDRLKINSIDIGIKGDQFLLMSTSPELETFKEELTDDDLKVDDFLFAPVSSMHKNTWYDAQEELPLFYDSSSPALDGRILEEVASGGFYQQKIYLLSSVNYYATLDFTNNDEEKRCSFEANSTFNTRRASEIHKQYPQFSEDEIKEKLDSLVDCLRISILVNDPDYYRYYIIDPKKKSVDEEIYFASCLDNDGDGYYDVYDDPDGHKREVIYGEVKDASKVVFDNPESDEKFVVPSNSGNRHFLGNSFDAKHRPDAYTFNKDASLANDQTLFAKEESYAIEELASNDTELLIPCYRNEPREIVISIYLEGWDEACINQTMGACFDTKLSFKLLRGIDL